MRDPSTYDRFEQIVLVHGVRTVDELAYRDLLTEHLPAHDLLGEAVREKLRYYPTVTSEAFPTTARVTQLLAEGKLFDDLGLPPPTPADDRFMLCGSPDMLRDARDLLQASGYAEARTANPGDFVVERALVDQ